MYQSNDILRTNKFGRGNITYIAQGLTRASDIVIVQENKQPNSKWWICFINEIYIAEMNVYQQ